MKLFAIIIWPAGNRRPALLRTLTSNFAILTLAGVALAWFVPGAFTWISNGENTILGQPLLSVALGLIMLAMVLNQVGLPVEGIAIIIGVDRLLDMTRTAVNVTGDCMVTCVVAKSEGELDESIFNDPNAAKDLEDYHKSID